MIPVPLLLADPSPCLRYLVLRDLLGRAETDREVRAVAGLRAEDAIVRDLVSLQGDNGAWRAGDGAWPSRSGATRMTAFALMRLGYLGFGDAFEPVRRGADFLFSKQRKDGSWPLAAKAAAAEAAEDTEEDREGYTMIPMQTAFPLRGLAACGYATDPRAERAYQWLLDRRLDDGAWPTGHVAGTHGGVGGYRRLAHSRWGCRTNTTGALLCLAGHPERCTSDAARRGLDLVLGSETREAGTLGWETARILGAEPIRGRLTYFARIDWGVLLHLCACLKASKDDRRVAGAVAWVSDLLDGAGMWEYERRRQLSRWVLFDLLRSLQRLGLEGGWVGTELPTPFQRYTRRRPRY